MCLYPKLIRNKKYTKTKKNGGIIPAIVDNRVLAVPIGCGNCMECRKQEARKWQVRMLEDIKENKNGKFVTLTFSDESIKQLVDVINEEETKRLGGKAEEKDTGNFTIRDLKIKGYELDNEIATIAVRRFLERWRKEHKKSVRHWLITELGHNGTENIHLHGIIWTDKPISEIRKHWKYGYIWPKKDNDQTYVNGKTVNYITKYVTKRDKDHQEYKSKILCSAGIGSRYTKTRNAEYNKYVPRETNEAYKTESGHKIGLPIYYRNKIYNDEEREKLWIEKLDEKVRWVDGTKVSIENGEEEYNKLLKQAQEKNKKLGYGTGTKNWNRKKYEEEKRTLLQQKRYNNDASGKTR